MISHLRFEKKFGLFGYVWLELKKKTIAIFEISTLEFSICEVLSKNKKYLHLGHKVLYLGVFGLEFKKAIFQINALVHLSKCKVWCKIRILKFGTNAFGINALVHLSKCKVWCKIRILKFGTKNA